MTAPCNGRTGWRTKDANQADDYAEKDEYTQRELMEEAMDVLNERERDILTQRRLQDNPVTLEDLSGVYNVSRERIRQIEVRAFEKLQKRMRELAKEQGMLATA
jgi:RNA polymerase sigma-32 factor